MTLRTITRNLAQYYLVQFEDKGIAILSNDKIVHDVHDVENKYQLERT